MPKLCLFDASGYLHRAYHALPPLTTSAGEPVNAVYGFSRMVSKVLKMEKPEYVGVCLDTPAPTFRHKGYAEYKATRVKADDALVHQLPLAEELTLAWGLPVIKKDGYEADDLIATLAKLGKESGCEVLILSGDKDILQLVEEKIKVRDEVRGVEYDTQKVVDRYGVPPRSLIDVFCLIGDKVDNVAGIPGVGEKTAVKLIAQHGSLSNALKSTNGVRTPILEKVVSSQAILERNRRLISLADDVPLGLSLSDLKPRPPEPEALSVLLNRLEFKAALYGAENIVANSALSLNTERRVRVVLDPAALDQLVAQGRTAERIAYDLETDGLNSRTCRLVGISFSFAPQEAWYVPIGHDYLGVPKQLSWAAVQGAVKPFMENPASRKYGQNMKFDNAILLRHGVRVAGPLFDTMIAAYCLDPSRNSYGLKDLAASFLGEQMTRIDELIGKGKSETFDQVPIDKAAPYAGADAEVVGRLASILEKDLHADQEAWDLFTKLEMPLVEVVQAMEAAGIAIDAEELRRVGDKFSQDKASIEKEIFSLAGETFVINSPKQLAKILFEKLKIPTARRTKTGFSTDESVLSKLAAEFPICRKILDYRELAKLISTYVESLLALADPETGRVHTSFNQTGTSTGRLSSSDPNLQNIPIRSDHGRLIRQAFVAPAGHVLLSADYSQIDLRALAHVSEDPALIEAFSKGGDIHTATASDVFHVPADRVTSDMRRRAKAINFGIVYGQQAFGLSQSLGISMEEAKEFIQRYFEKYSGVRSWIDRTLETARHTGFVTTLAGRRRPVRDINSSNGAARGFAERVATNTPIQGSSADIIKAAMIRCRTEFLSSGIASRMLLQVHDELLFEVPNGEITTVVPIIRASMEGAFSLRVPLVVDMKSGANWNAMQKIAPARAA